MPFGTTYFLVPAFLGLDPYEKLLLSPYVDLRHPTRAKMPQLASDLQCFRSQMSKTFYCPLSRNEDFQTI